MHGLSLLLRRDGICLEQEVLKPSWFAGWSKVGLAPEVTILGGCAMARPDDSHRIPPRHWYEGNGYLLSLEGGLEERERLCSQLTVSESLTDTELVIEAWRRWGREGLCRLRGPIGVMLVDLKDRERPCAVLYREPLGRRELYYSASSQWFLATRQPSGLLMHPEVSREPDRQWLTDAFALSFSAGQRTPFRDVRKLLPGEVLICTPDEIQLHREPLNIGHQDLRYRRDGEYAEHFRELLERSVARCLAGSGDRVGIMLSGGMDSGPLAALAQRELSAKGRKLIAYSWSLPGFELADESTEIKDCAKFVGCDLRLLPGTDEWPMRDLESWPIDPNSPFTNSLRRLKLKLYAAAASDGCSVILNGASGDHLYPHPKHRLRDAWRSRRFGYLLDEILFMARARGGPGLWRDASTRMLGRHLLRWKPNRRRQIPAWLSAGARQAWAIEDSAWPPESVHHPRPDHFLSALDQKAADGLSGDVFFAHRLGIERRDPFRDLDLIDFMLSVPAHRSYRKHHTKCLARQGMVGFLPESIRLRPRGGLLNEFFDAGYRREHDALEVLLSASDVAWPDYVDHKWLVRALRSAEPSDGEKLMVWQCAAFELWRRALSGEQPDLLRFARGDS